MKCLMHKDDFNIFAKDKKEPWNIMQNVIISSHNIRI